MWGENDGSALNRAPSRPDLKAMVCAPIDQAKMPHDTLTEESLQAFLVAFYAKGRRDASRPPTMRTKSPSGASS